MAVMSSSPRIRSVPGGSSRILLVFCRWDEDAHVVTARVPSAQIERVRLYSWVWNEFVVIHKDGEPILLYVRHTDGHRWKLHRQNALEPTRHAHFPAGFNTSYMIGRAEGRLSYLSASRVPPCKPGSPPRPIRSTPRQPL